jgi:hypothetical protein
VCGIVHSIAGKKKTETEDHSVGTAQARIKFMKDVATNTLQRAQEVAEAEGALVLAAGDWNLTPEELALACKGVRESDSFAPLHTGLSQIVHGKGSCMAVANGFCNDTDLYEYFPEIRGPDNQHIVACVDLSINRLALAASQGQLPWGPGTEPEAPHAAAYKKAFLEYEKKRVGPGMQQPAATKPKMASRLIGGIGAKSCSSGLPPPPSRLPPGHPAADQPPHLLRRRLAPSPRLGRLLPSSWAPPCFRLRLLQPGLLQPGLHQQPWRLIRPLPRRRAKSQKPPSTFSSSQKPTSSKNVRARRRPRPSGPGPPQWARRPQDHFLRLTVMASNGRRQSGCQRAAQGQSIPTTCRGSLTRVWNMRAWPLRGPSRL